MKLSKQMFLKFKDSYCWATDMDKTSLLLPVLSEKPRQAAIYYSTLFGIICSSILIFQTASFAQAPRLKAISLAAFHDAVALEDYTEAKRQADSLLPKSKPAEALKISLAYGRILLGLKLKEPARQYLAVMSKQKLAGDAPTLMAVYAAWLEALDDKPDNAIKSLEAILKKEGQDMATAEAADVLAMLSMAKGDRAAAKKAVEFGLATLKYKDLKTDYTETLLLRRMKSHITSPEAEQLYYAADNLRQKGKFSQAAKGYEELVQKFPKSEWVAPATFYLGRCQLELDNPQKAFELWQKFIKEAPEGPWRGQARVAMIDLALKQNLDLAMASEHALTATATLGKPLAKEAASSWKSAAYDINLRQGIVSLAEGRYEAAAQAFQEARAKLPTPPPAEDGTPIENPQAPRLKRLIEAAKEQSPLVPKELLGGEAKALTALTMGGIYQIFRDFDTAKKFFNSQLIGKGRSNSPPHRSFASFGLARATAAAARNTDQEMAQANQAKSLYEQSLKEHPKGTWHDETFRELAFLMERLAELHRPDNRAGVKKSELTRPQLKQYAADQAKAIPYWLELEKKHPKSRYAPQALYHIGILYSKAEKPVEALKAFEELVAKFPNTPWTGDAALHLIDVKLEQQFDLAGAERLATSALNWYERVADTESTATSSSYVPIGESSGTSHTLTQVGYNIYLRAGLIEYLKDRNKQAITFFEKARLLQPPPSVVILYGQVETPVERLIKVAESGESPTPQTVRQGDAKLQLILVWADLFHECDQQHKAIELYDKIIQGAVPGVTVPQRAWAHFRRGRSQFCLEGKEHNPVAAMQDYLASVKLAPKSPWADKALFLTANIHWNTRHDANAAVQTWEQLIKSYPQSEEVERSAYFIGVIYQWSGQPGNAKQAFRQFLKKYPSSRFAPEAKERLEKISA